MLPISENTNPSPIELEKDYFSRDTNKTLQEVYKLESDFSSSTVLHTFGKTLEEKLFDARADVKILISQVSMYLDDNVRGKLFDEIDILHDADEWEDGDEPVSLESFKTFLRWYYLNKPNNLPSFGLSVAGNFIASWMDGDTKNSLVLEFLKNDRIKWFVTKYYGDEIDSSVGTSQLVRVHEILLAYDANNIFFSVE